MRAAVHALYESLSNFFLAGFQLWKCDAGKRFFVGWGRGLAVQNRRNNIKPYG
jgi:hypothetical protein